MTSNILLQLPYFEGKKQLFQFKIQAYYHGIQITELQAGDGSKGQRKRILNEVMLMTNAIHTHDITCVFMTVKQKMLMINIAH